MREIKFRGKTKVLNKWVVGSLIIDKERTWISVQQEHWNMGTFDNIEVVPESVGQYTGLKDINGVEIYEGDIVNHFYRYYVGMDEVSEEMEVVEIKDLTHLPFDLSTIGCEAIGNIYENKELLEAKGNE